MSKFKNQVHKEDLEEVSFLKKITTSHFNYWFGYVSNLSIVVFLCTRAFSGFTSLLTWFEWLYIPVAGLLLWTLVEYVMHKYAYHVIKGPAERGHMMHHDRPYDLMGVPWYVTLIIYVGVYYGLSYLLSPPHLAVYMAFIWLGYIGYCIVHHAIHHWKFNNKLFKKLKRHHYIHHARDNKNIGIVTTLWDHIFGTIEKS
ncbi:MAG: sterol desaturase family protein [Vicingaceae bacterium]|nr:sterol desaturase family protein [Vicingaceae bacterium]